MSGTASGTERSGGARLAVGALVLLTVGAVLVAATLGTFFVGDNAASACTPDGQGPSCARTTVLPWTHAGLQVVVLGVGLIRGRTQRRRAASATGAVTATLVTGLVTVATSAVVLVVLLGVADA